MKKAILFVLVLGFVLMGVVADATTAVELNYAVDNISATKIIFGTSAIENMTNIVAPTTSNDADLVMTTPSKGATSATIDFYLSWYHYSPAALEVTLKVGAMKAESNPVSYLSWEVTPTVDSTYKEGTENTATPQKITASTTDPNTTTDMIVVSVANNAEGKMIQSFGNVKLVGVATLTGAKPEDYTSSITAAITTK